jgi:uncharacterized protein (PEP-CTERM system associated)
MTITTVKLARAVAQAYARPLGLPLMVAALLLAAPARADWTFVPTVDLRQTYTDNVALQRDGLEKSQFVTELTPGFRLKHAGPRLVVNAGYQLHYYAMQDRDISGTNRSSRNLSADAHAKLVEDLLYLDAIAGMSQQNVSPYAQTPNNGFASTNRTEVKTWRLSPYLVHRFGSSATAELRYARDSVDAGTSGLGNTEADSLMLKLDSGAAFRTLGWGLQLSEQKIADDVADDTSIKAANANLRYRIAPTLNLTAGLGYDKYDYQALGGATGGKAWDTGFAWTPTPRTSLTASLGRRYYGPSRSLKALHRSRHTAWSINYDDAVTSTRANFLLPASIDTAALLDNLFRSMFPDPVERQRAVAAYIISANLPPSLAENINYFSNRYSLQKQLRASVAFRQGRTSVLYSLYRVRRDALSMRATDSELLGSTLNTINDRTEQQGFSATLDYRLSPRTQLNLSSEISDNASLVNELKSRSTSVRFSARHQLRAKLSGTVELRRIHGAVLAGQPYTEHAVAASLSMQL